MLKMKRYSKLVPILLVLALFCSACSVPDISEFTKQSAEMTRGIRTGLNDTGNLIKTAAGRDDLFSPDTRAALKKDLKKYQEAVKPTVAALDALDEYLDALNALAQANAKSGDNAKAVVTSVGNLVNAVSGLTFASSVVNTAAGLLTLAEQFRTSRDFKQRVNLAALIVEGRFDEHTATYTENGKTKQRTYFVKACGANAADIIAIEGAKIKAITDPIFAPLTKAQTDTLEPLGYAERLVKLAEFHRVSDELQTELSKLQPNQRRERLVALGIMTSTEKTNIEQSEAVIATQGCGVIDLIKFNLKDLKDINLNLSKNMADNVYRRNRTVLGFYDSLNANDRSTQRELETILNYKSYVTQIRESRSTGGDAADRLDNKIKLKELLDNLFIMDGTIHNDVLAELDRCGGACANMKAVVEFNLCAACYDPIVALINAVDESEFDRADGYIEPVLEERASKLDDQNSKYLDDLERITPSHTAVISEIKALNDRQDQLDATLTTSMSALDTWAKTHANLRVALNSKKPLTVSALASRVREIWSTINPPPKSN